MNIGLLATARIYAALLCGALAACATPTAGDGTGADATAPQVAIGGAVERPGSLSLAQLQALPAVTQTVKYGMGATPQTRTFTGADLWTLLDSRGIKADTPAKTDFLRKYVVARGSDGYRAAFSLAELRPDFGNRGSLVAYAELIDGKPVDLKSSGYVRVTAPGDVRGGRYVTGLVRIDVRSSASMKTGNGGGASMSFDVSGAVVRPATFDLAALQALPVVERTVGSNVYRGVSLWELLDKTAGLALDAAVKGDVLARYVVATGSDGYQALFTLGELHPAFGAQPVLIAYQADGAALGGKGFARIVVPNDIKAGRWVSNLVSLEVFAAQ